MVGQTAQGHASGGPGGVQLGRHHLAVDHDERAGPLGHRLDHGPGGRGHRGAAAGTRPALRTARCRPRGRDRRRGCSARPPRRCWAAPARRPARPPPLAGRAASRAPAGPERQQDRSWRRSSSWRGQKIHYPRRSNSTHGGACWRWLCSIWPDGVVQVKVWSGWATMVQPLAMGHAVVVATQQRQADRCRSGPRRPRQADDGRRTSPAGGRSPGTRSRRRGRPAPGVGRGWRGGRHDPDAAAGPRRRRSSRCRTASHNRWPTPAGSSRSPSRVRTSARSSSPWSACTTRVTSTTGPVVAALGDQTLAAQLGQRLGPKRGAGGHRQVGGLVLVGLGPSPHACRPSTRGPGGPPRPPRPRARPAGWWCRRPDAGSPGCGPAREPGRSCRPGPTGAPGRGPCAATGRTGGGGPG